MNYVDMAASIAQDEAELMEDFTAIVLIVSTAIMLRAAERKKRNRRTHGGSTQGRAPNRSRGMKQCGDLLGTHYFCRRCLPMASSSVGTACRATPTK
jgi:hypothetical protein